MENNSNRIALKSGLWFTISNFLMKSIGFITTPVFTRLMSKTEFGDFNNYQTWMMILLYITSLNLEGSLIRASKEFKDDINNYTYSMIMLSLFSTVIWFFIVNVFSGFFTMITSINRFYINWMFAYLIFTPIINLFQNVERFKYHYKWTVISSLFVSIGASLLSVILVLIMTDKLFARTIGYILPNVILGSIIFLYYKKKNTKVYFKYWKYALPIALPYIPHLLSMYLLNSVDKVMIKWFCGSEMLAMYSLAYTCGMLITILINSLNNAYSPWLADKLSLKEFRVIKKFSKIYVAVFCVFSICAVLVTPEVLYVLGGKGYIDAKYVLPPVAAGCLLQFVYCMYVNIEQYEKKTVGMAVASAIAAIVNVILNYFLIPQFGYIVAAYTTYCGYFILLLMHMNYVKKLGMLHVYDNLKIFIMAVFTSGIIICVSFIINNIMLRYIFLIIILCFMIYLMWRKRSFIKNFYVKKG